jgi:mannose-6-phosphate isomerase-like protein (cupin superfamily)
MEIFDLKNLQAQGYENRKVNVIYQNDVFKTRIIVLEAQGKIPKCQMDTHVMFYVVEGEVILHKNNETSVLKENQLFISEPALLSMESAKGARLMGIQIKTPLGEENV